jgi:hypothetical protein
MSDRACQGLRHPAPAEDTMRLIERREEFEQLVTEILVALDPWTDLRDGPDVDDAREAVMRELLAYDQPRGAVEENERLREAAQHAADVAREFGSSLRLPEWAQQLDDALRGQ